jgi:hypothetical protein
LFSPENVYESPTGIFLWLNGLARCRGQGKPVKDSQPPAKCQYSDSRKFYGKLEQEEADVNNEESVRAA